MGAVHGWHIFVEQLDSGQIHLWLAWLGEITDSRLLAEYRSLLSEEELAKQGRFHLERDRHRYLVTRAMVRTVLSNTRTLSRVTGDLLLMTMESPRSPPSMPKHEESSLTSRTQMGLSYWASRAGVRSA